MTDGPVLLVVDAANVVGSVPDGWWRDRAAATSRLRDALVSLARDGTEVVLVVEGAARDIEAVPGVQIVRASGSGDDAIVDLVRNEERDCVVVTADRALRDRVTGLGARVMGPRSIPRS